MPLAASRRFTSPFLPPTYLGIGTAPPLLGIASFINAILTLPAITQ